MKSTIKITPPNLINKLNDGLDLSSLLNGKDEEIIESSFSAQFIEGITRDNLSGYSSLLSNCIFSQCKLRKAQFSDMIFKNCDLSNIHFTGSSFTRVEFNGCKLTGTNFSECTFNQVTFNECRGEYINLSGSKLRNVLFNACILRGGAFDNALLTNTFFSSCNLIEAEFYRTSLKGIDLSSSEIAGIRILALPPNELRGAKVSTLQALELARLLGIEIED